MGDFSQRALAIQPTGVRKMFDLAGDDVISFGLGEPDFQPPPIAIEAFHQAMLDGRNKYTTTAGLPPLRAKIAESWHHLEPGLMEDNVCITMSGTNALLNLFLTLVDPGKNVLLPEPYFPLYGPDVTLCGGESRYYPCLFENAFVPTIEDLESLVDEDTVAILYNFPSNPTGGTLTVEQRDELLAFAQKHDLWILSDEVYDRIVFDSEHVSFVGTDYDKVLLINSFSKTFAMTGWRIGYIMSANLEAMKQVTRCNITSLRVRTMRCNMLYSRPWRKHPITPTFSPKNSMLDAISSLIDSMRCPVLNATGQKAQSTCFRRFRFQD